MYKSPVQSGFTLIELMVTLAVAAVVLTLGVPSFQQTIQNNRLVTQANNLIAALNMARSEAIKRGTNVTLCKRNSAGTACNNAGNWEGGWLLFTDLNGNGAFADNGNSTPCEANEDCILRDFGALPSGFTLRTGANYTCWVSYRPSGGVSGSGSSCTGGLANDTFRLCRGTDAANARSIAVNTVGRAMSQKGSASCP